MPLSGSFAGGMARGFEAGEGIRQRDVQLGQAQQQIDLRKQQAQQAQQQGLLKQAQERIDSALTQAGEVMTQAHKKAALIEDPKEKAQLLDAAKQAATLLEKSVSGINQRIGGDPAILTSRFATIREQVGITGEQQLKAQATGMEERAKAEVKEEFRIPAGGQSRTAVSPEGEQRQAYFDPEKRKNFFTDGEEVPQGWQVLSATAQLTGEEAGLTTKAKGEIETKLIDLDNSLANLEQIEASFDPKFLTLPSQLQIGGLELAEKAGIELSPENRELVERKATFMQNAIEAVNTVIKQITGAQMSEMEAGRIRKQIPDPEKDGPTAFRTKLRNSIKSAKLAKARYQHMRKYGLDHDFESKDEPPISLDQMEDILDKRVEEMRGLNVPDDKIREALRQEFGI